MNIKPTGLLALAGTLLMLGSGVAAGSQGVSYFRSDGGVAAGVGPLPARLDDPQLLQWRVELDGGHSTPIRSAGRIFLTTYREQNHELAAVALDEATGELLWRQAKAVERVEQTHTLGSPATASPACDGERVFVFYGSLSLLCYDLDGKLLWTHPLGPFQDEYGAGSSPILLDGKVILNQDHDIDSFLIALESRTGKKLWQTARPDAVRSYATPAVWVRNGRPELLVAGALELAGYAADNGEKLWSVHGLARIVIPTPIPQGDTVYLASWAPGGDPTRRLALDPWPAALSKWDQDHDGKLTKIEIKDPEVLDRFNRMDLNQDGQLDQAEWERHAAVFRRAENAAMALQISPSGEIGERQVLWKHARGAPYVATPLVDQGRFWMVKDGGIVTQLDARTGKLLHEERLPGMGNYFSSPVAGDDKVYFASEPGVVSVVANQSDWQILSSREFREKIYATPLLHHDRLYLRTERALYCFRGTKN